MRSAQPSEKSFCGLGLSARLQIYVEDVAVLIQGSPQVETLILDADEYVVDEERIAKPGCLRFSRFENNTPNYQLSPPKIKIGIIVGTLGGSAPRLLDLRGNETRPEYEAARR